MVNPNPPVDNSKPVEKSTTKADSAHQKKEPTGDFRKVLESNEKDSESQEEGSFGNKKEGKVGQFNLFGIPEEESSPSLFDLVAKKPAKMNTEALPPQKAPQENPNVQKKDLQGNLVTPDKVIPDKDSLLAEVVENTGGKEAVNLTKEPEHKKETLAVPKAEQVVTGISSQKDSPMSVMVNSTSATSNTKIDQSERIEAIKIITDYIDKAAQVIETGSLQETSVTLAKPPLFEGAQLTVVIDKANPKELMVKFENLSPDAKQLLDIPGNRETLMKNLSDKGYMLQGFVTSNVPSEQIVRTEGANPNDQFNRGNQPREEEQRKDKDQNPRDR